MIPEYAKKDLFGNVLHTVPCVQYPIDEHRHMIVLGGEEEPQEIDAGDDMATISMGRLSAQGFLVKLATKNSLTRDGWDFDKHPDPLIYIIYPV